MIPWTVWTTWWLAAAPVGAAFEPDSAGRGFVLGGADAAVQVVAFTDFGCPACAHFAVETFPDLREGYVEPGQVRWELVPVSLGFRHSTPALRAALCAGEQGGFWPMHDLLFARQTGWRARRSPDAVFTGLAAEAGIDTTAFASCQRSKRHDERIRQLTKRGRAAGIRGTPAVLVGERWVYGSQSVAAFRAVLDEALRARSDGSGRP